MIHVCRRAAGAWVGFTAAGAGMASLACYGPAPLGVRVGMALGSMWAATAAGLYEFVREDL